MVVLDTNIIIDFLDGKQEVVEALSKYNNFELATTFVNQYELLKYKKKSHFEEALKNLTIYHSSESAILASSESYKLLKEKGKLISDNDLLIFGVCLANNEMLLTRDGDFKNLQSDRVILIK